MSDSDNAINMERSHTRAAAGAYCRAFGARSAAVPAAAARFTLSAAGRGVLRRRRVACRLLFWILLSAVLLPMTSCRRAVEKARRNMRIEAVEKVERQGLSGAEVVVRVTNDTGYKVVLKQARIDVFHAGNLVTSILLREPVEVPRRTAGSVSSLWKMRTPDPMALYALKRKLQQGEAARVSVTLSVEGRGGPSPVKISEQMMPLSEFLNIFGLSLQDVKNYLEE